ncbi:MAG TPA: sialate O-acetylesterase [Bacteroidota bacterium]|nr:sialate O-acetylesterase [Bacteroidota bacterium]
MKSTLYRRILIYLLGISVGASAIAQVRLPRLVSDGMVLQRDSKVKVWGWAGRGEKISVHFIDSVYTAFADSAGDWSIVLAGLKAGGPYEMRIEASNVLTVKDIMIGEVWVCSGQSNMELTMKTVRPIYEDEIANAQNPFIREFTVPQTYDFNKPHQDLDSGSWQSATPATVLQFSAVAYFFGKELYEQYKVPIGLINTSLGGSPIESWMSEDALKKFPVAYKEAQRFKDPLLIRKIESEDRARIGKWYALARESDEGHKDPSRLWTSPSLKTSGWPSMKIPGYWMNTALGRVNGVVWFRKEFTVPVAMTGVSAKLILGRIVDADSAFVNGTFVGTTSYQYPPRRYEIPAGVLKEGKNILVVRVINESGAGGFVPDKQYEIVAGGQTIDLKGDWQYRLGASMPPLASQTFIRWKPLGLYNAMIAPLLKYSVKGAIWYQGESNAGSPIEYRELLPSLIADWRQKWGEGDFPFLIVQLPNFMTAKEEPSQSDWALLREAQLRTLSTPNTGLAVTIDVGEWNDIHPLNKKEVGKRLALAAQKVAYGDEHVVSSGPIYRSMKVDGNKIILTFSSVGGGLVAKGGVLKSFAIAGADMQFVWGDAKIEGDNVVVSSATIANPVAVRYAWADNPADANLYNKEGFPASPFRTDE